MSLVTITCETCSVQRVVTASYAKRISGIYCSRQCASQRLSTDDLYEKKTCPQCSESFRALKSRRRMFCSDSCAGTSRRVEGAKWRDPDQIRAYMSEYAKKNRRRLSDQSKEWGARNSEKRKAISAAYAHRTRQKSADRSIRRTLIKNKANAASADRVVSIFARANHHCVYCAGKCSNLTLDHYVPVAIGGGHNPGNLVPCCKPCNSSKWMHDPEDWIEEKHGIMGIARVHVFLSRRKIIWSLYERSEAIDE